jgi:hypothetical protein
LARHESMSFMEKARQAAEQARQAASQGIGAMSTPEAKAEMREAASQMGVQFRDAAGQAKRGLITAIEKIDPGILADLIIKATALQELANRSLREKASSYRIGEITITASIPPQIGFAITRLDEEPEQATGQMLSSSELAASVDGGAAEVVTLEGEIIETVPAEEPVG